MEISETKKSNKVLLTVTYCFAAVCLLLGFFLPLFNGDEILALQLPAVLNTLAGSVVIKTDKVFALAGLSVITFGSETFSLDFGALIIALYAIITVLAVLALIPIGICCVKHTQADRIIAYSIEVAAVIVLSLYVVIALPVHSLLPIGYNMVIALGGTVLALAITSVANKKATGFAKVCLFLFSAIALLTLFDYTSIIPSLAEPLDNLSKTAKLYPSYFTLNGVNLSGIELVTLLFATKYPLEGEASLKAAMLLGTIAGLLIIVNYLIDVISLASDAKRKGLAFNIIRYTVELAAVICLIITSAIANYGIGLFLVAAGVSGIVRLAVSVVRYLKAAKHGKAEKEAAGQTTMFARPAKAPKQKAAEQRYDDIIVDVPESEVPSVGAQPAQIDAEPVPAENKDEQMAFIEPASEAAEFEEAYEEPVTENPDEVQMEIEGTASKDVYSAPEPAQPESAPAPEPVRPVYGEPVSEPAQPESAPAYEPVQPVYEAKPEPKQEPVKTFNPVQRYTIGPDGELVYTIRYGGPVDEFINKLSNEEKIEFAMTFIERNKGDIGNIPEYVIGGNNKKFFSAVFIYLGRIRGMISDGLLNKMFKELNML